MELFIILVICALIWGNPPKGSSSSSRSSIFRRDPSNRIKMQDHAPKTHNWCNTDYHGTKTKKTGR